jgi:hypothetical protein
MPYPLPKSQNEPPARCIECRGTNQFGEPNAGLPVYPYPSSLLRHAGRYVDSQDTGDFRNILRTIRARTIRVFPQQNRLLIQMGNVAASYRLDTFFTSALARGLASINRGRGTQPDLYTPFDGFFYPEASGSGWTFGSADLQDPMGTKGIPLDLDDRGLLYVAYPAFGWGIAKDEGRNDGSLFTNVVQMTEGTRVIPDSIVSVRVGSRYFAVIAGLSDGAAVFDVTDAARPQLVTSREGGELAMRRYDRSDAAQRVAYIDSTGRLHVIAYANLTRGERPLASFTGRGGAFADVAFDEEGNIWAAENSRDSRLWKLTPSGAGYAAAEFTPFGTNFREVRALAAGAGHIAVVGTDRSAGAKYDVRLCRIEPNGPRLLDLGSFFKNYYHSGTAGYAAPGQYALPFDLALVRQGTKTYLMYSASGLGDVYEIVGATQPGGGGPRPDLTALRAECERTAREIIEQAAGGNAAPLTPFSQALERLIAAVRQR